MNTEKRIALIAFACFIGAVTGALLALQFNHYFWWAGILLGGITGYLSYEFKTVIRVAKSIWNHEHASHFKAIRERLSRAVTVFSLVLRLEAAFLASGLSWMSIFLLIICPSILFEEDKPSIMGIVLSGSLIFGAMSYALCLAFENVKDAHNIRSVLPIVFFRYNAFSFLSHWFPKHLWLARHQLVDGICLGMGFAKRIFVLIHSEIRLLCMTDAMLGALAGYFCGNALIGGVVGAILGIVNYKLVSVRWLKLVRV